MSLDLVASSLLPKEAGQAIRKIVGDTALLNSTTSNNVAKNNAVQVCGPVADRIEYVLNLSLHYHAAERDSSWRLEGGIIPNARTTVSSTNARPGAAQKVAKTPEKRPMMVPCNRHILDIQISSRYTINLRNSKNVIFPVIATADPNLSGNWIACRIVKRLNFQHEEAAVRKRVPLIEGIAFQDTRIYVDLAFGGLDQCCQHRFYVVNNCKTFDVIFGNGDSQIHE